MLTYVHPIIRIAIVYHPTCNGRGSMFSVGEYAYLRGSFNESLVKFRPRAAGK